MEDLTYAKEGAVHPAEVPNSDSVVTSKEDTTCPKCACKGPNPGYAIISDEDLDGHMSTLNPNSKWALAENRKSISRKFVCRNWQAAMNAIQAIGAVAESEGVKHHPDIHLTNYREVELVLQTHSISGLTNYDFILARGIDGVEVDYSPKWLKENAAKAV